MTTSNDDAVREVEREQRVARRHTTSTPRADEPTKADLTRELHYMESQAREHGFPGTRAVLNELARLRAEVAARNAIVEELRATTTALGWVATAFRKIDEGSPGSPPHVSADSAKDAYERGMAALRDYDALTGRCCGGGRAPCPTHYAKRMKR